MKKITSIFLAAVLCIGLAVPAGAAGSETVAGFTDVKPGDWYAEAVEYVTSHGLFSGTSSGTFEPNLFMTRGMVVTVLAKMAGVNADSIIDNGKFEDNAFNTWYGAAVVWASENGYVNGTTTHTFFPPAPITREQITVILYNFLCQLDVDFPDKGAAAFKDIDAVSAWAKTGVSTMCEWGFVNGDENGNYAPQRVISRAEAATLFMNVDKFLRGNSVPLGVCLSNTKLDLAAEETARLEAYVIPNGVSGDITWTSSNSSVATVDANGTVTGVSAGTVTITASTKTGQSAKCTVTTYGGNTGYTDGTDETNEYKKVLMGIGETYQLKLPGGAGGDLSWTFSKPGVLSISDSGLVTALSSGYCIVTLTGSGVERRSYAFLVLLDPTPFVNGCQTEEDMTVYARLINGDRAEYRYYSTWPEDSVTWQWEASMPQIGLLEGDSDNTRRISPAGYFYDFSSSDSQVATADEKGTILIHGPGDAVITATPKEGVLGTPYSVHVSVEEYSSGHEILFNIREGFRTDMNRKFRVALTSPDGDSGDVNYMDVTVESSDTSVAEVSCVGSSVTINTHKPGFATITAKTKFGTTAEMTLEVIDYQAERNEQINRMLALIREDMTEYEKLETMAHYVVDTYGYSNHDYTAEAMYIYGEGDCLAFANLVTEFCDQLGLECIIRRESNSLTDSHYANRVKADGVWYHVDTSVNKGTTLFLYPADDMS